MALTVDSLVLGRIIGDVVDMFVPSVNMTIKYEKCNHNISNGSHLRPSFAISPPTVTISGHSHQLYTLVMTDPDAPSPSEPSHRECLHWIVTDIPADATNKQGNEVVAHMGPSPRVGIHRYIFILYQQKGPVGFIDWAIQRPNFNTRAFAQYMDLGLPVAAVYFNSQKEPARRRRF